MKRKHMEDSSDLRSSSSILNPDVLEEIFFTLPPQLVVCVCRLVCHQWKDLVDQESFWRQRCKREGYHPLDPSKNPENWMKFYFMCKWRRNLIKNPRGEEGLDKWVIRHDGGDGWKVEGIFTKHPNSKVQKNFVTSYTICEKYQTIDLEKEGYNSSFMDNLQPDIRICEWYTSRSDSHCEYNIRVELLNENMEIIQVFSPKTIKISAGTHRNWIPMTHTFQNYGPGVRYIRFCHGGKDGKYWKGWYGVRITESSVEICPA